MKSVILRVALSCILIFKISQSQSQEKVGEIVNFPDFNIKRNTDLLIHEDFADSARSCLYAFSREQILALEFDRNKTITSQTYSNSNYLKFPNLLGGVYADKKSVLVYTNGRKKSFNAVSVNNQRKFLVNKEIYIDKDEIFLESFEQGKYYYVVTVGWTASYLVFYRIDNDLNLEMHRVELADLTFGANEKGLYKNLLEQSSEIQISNVSYETINNLATAASRNKIYVFDSTFVLTLDKYFGQTLILKINLQDWNKSLNIISFNTSNCKKSNSNSFLLHHWLFKSQVCDDQLRLSIFDYKTGVELNSFSAESEEGITFKNTPITQEGGKTIFAADSRELSKTTALVRKMLNSKISLAVNTTNSCQSCFEISIGSFEEWEVAAPVVAGPTYTGGGTVSLGGETVRIPGTFSPTFNGYTKGVLTKSAFFKTLLQGDNFSHKLGPIETNSFDLIKKFSNDNESKIITKTVFYRTGQYYLAYFSKDSKSFIIMEF